MIDPEPEADKTENEAKNPEWKKCKISNLYKIKKIMIKVDPFLFLAFLIYFWET